MSEETVAAEVRRWFQRARRDFRMAEQALADGDAGGACYTAQQAAEKAIKAALISLQVEFPYTHLLAPLMERVPVGWELKGEDFALQDMNKWALAGRYPDAGPEPGPEQASEAIARARAILDAAARDLAVRGHNPAG